MRIIALAVVAALLIPGIALAAVIDASAAEAAYKSGDYRRARALFETAAADFRAASKDSSDYHMYREAAYLYDRLADCCFTQRDWDAMKTYLDGLLVVSVSERNLCESQLSGAMESGIAYATARHLRDKLDESVRLSTIFQLKRSLGLVLYDTGGEGGQARQAIDLYQELAAVILGPVYLEDGNYLMNVPLLEERITRFDAVFDQLEQLGDIDALWEKYPPEGDSGDDSAETE
jgi:tetratricopeptide (TPR) repeat protein